MNLFQTKFILFSTILLIIIKISRINGSDDCPEVMREGARMACEHVNRELLIENSNDTHNTVKRDNQLHPYNNGNHRHHPHHHLKRQHYYHTAAHQHNKQQQQQQHHKDERHKNEVTYDESSENIQHRFPTRVRKHNFPKHGYLVMDRYYAKYLKSLNKGYLIRPHTTNIRTGHQRNGTTGYVRRKRDDNKVYIDYCCQYDCSNEFCGSK